MSEDRVREVFADALEQHPEQRRDFVYRACDDDPAVLARVLKLLSANERAAEFMAAPTLAHDRPAPPAAPSDDLGTVVGNYTIVSLLGQGGFGVVYLARQTHPVEREVAVKILKAGHHSPTADTRMDTERQLLARMQHPNIAHIFDAGRTNDGRPYFVMEYVPGKPITEWADEHHLPVPQRLELFQKVCGAVQHAHHKGIIHRDLKPSNVLVMEIDGSPEVRVIDFGIAKAAEMEPGDPMVTIEGQIIGTPAYMSPEQITGSGSIHGGGIDTRSDVYALGVVLYELLARTTPFDRERLSKAGLATIARIICEEEPARPSTRVLDAGVLDAQASRRLSSELRGELDWIVLRAMEKDPARRYQSADALARDLRRFGRDEPLDAGPPSRVYRMRKFARRHRGAMAGASVAVLALLALVIASILFGVRAERQRRLIAVQLDRANELGAFSSRLLDGIDPAVARGKDATLVRQILDDSIRRIQQDPPDSPEASAEIHSMLGRGLFKIAAFDEADAQYTRALIDATAAYGSEDPRTLNIRAHRAEAMVESSDFDTAERELLIVRDAYERQFGIEHPGTLAAAFALAEIARMRGEADAAIAADSELLPRFIALHGSEHPETMSVRNSLGTLLGGIGRFDEAIDLLEQVIAYQQVQLGPDHPHLLATRSNLSGVYAKIGRTLDAIALQEEVLATKRRVLPPEHPSMLISLNNLSSLYKGVGRSDEAGQMLTEALAVSRATLGDRDLRTLILSNNLAEIHIKTDRPAEALALLETAIPGCLQTLPPEHPLLFVMLKYRAKATMMLDDREAAVAAARELVERTEATLPDRPADRGNARLMLGRALVAAGSHAEADATLREAWALLTEAPPGAQKADPALPRTPEAIEIAQLLAEANDALGRPDESARWNAAVGDADAAESDGPN